MVFEDDTKDGGASKFLELGSATVNKQRNWSSKVLHMSLEKIKMRHNSFYKEITKTDRKSQIPQWPNSNIHQVIKIN